MISVARSVPREKARCPTDVRHSTDDPQVARTWGFVDRRILTDVPTAVLARLGRASTTRYALNASLALLADHADGVVRNQVVRTLKRSWGRRVEKSGFDIVYRVLRPLRRSRNVDQH